MSSKQVHSNYRLLYNYVQSFPHFLWKLLRQKLVICLHSEDSYNGGGGGSLTALALENFLVLFLTGLHVFPTFVLYELTILLVLTLSVVILKVMTNTFLQC